MDYQRLVKIFEERSQINGPNFLTTCNEVKDILEAKGAEVEINQVDDWAKLRIFTNEEEWIVRISASGFEVSQVSNLIL